MVVFPISPAFSTQPPSLQLGQCTQTKIARLEQRLMDGITHRFIANSGSAVAFANGLYQVSYDQEAPITRSRLGDPVQICLVELPKGCPPGDNRGKRYKTTNLRTKESWTLIDSEHICGGA
jgi:hypothetical protein